MEILKTTQLCKYYRKTHALEHVSMTINKGDIYGFVGKNGAGKTTLIRVVTGVIQPTAGKYALFGNDNIKTIHQSRARLAAVVETPALYLSLSAYNNLSCQCTLHGIRKEDHPQVINTLLKKVGLMDLLDNKKKKAKNFSLGMKQRLGIAMALISNPEFLVLDEPNNGLDPEGIRDMRELLLKLNKEDGVTILVSSHILSELSKLATRYGFIHQGKLIKEVSAAQLQKELEKKIILTTNDNQKALEVLKDEKITAKVQQDETLHLFTQLSISQIINMMALEKIDIISIVEHQADLEQYFMDIIGSHHE